MRKIWLFMGGIAFLNMSVAVQALDGVERLIMKCRTSAVSQAAQITCLEKTLRDIGPAEPTTPDWAGTKSVLPIDDAAGERSVGTAGLGAEQVPLYGEDAQRAKEIRSITETSRVVDFAYTQSGRLIIVLSNGQVWKQRSGDLQTVKLKEGDTPNVLVRKGALSGYRMNFVDLNKTLIVSRLQ